jgi:hypothetical protein
MQMHFWTLLTENCVWIRVNENILELIRKRRNKTMGVKRGEKRELEILASDFCLLDRKDVREIIRNNKNYADSRRAILKIYDMVYMQ